jgi:hypothetical protein
MLMRFFSGCFALLMGGLCAQIPSLFEFRLNQTDDTLAVIQQRYSQYEKISSMASMPVDEFAVSLENHSDPAMQTKGRNISQLTQRLDTLQNTRNKMVAASSSQLIPILLQEHQVLNSLPGQTSYQLSLPETNRQYLYGFVGFVAGIILFSILLTLAKRLLSLHQRRQTRRILASRGYGF